MIPTVVLSSLVVVGLWYLSREPTPGAARERVAAGSAEPFTDDDWERPARILDDRSKLANGAVVLAGLSALGVGIGAVVTLFASSVFPDRLAVAAAGALVVGGVALALELYVRLGFDGPTAATAAERGDTPGESPATTWVESDVAGEFDAFRDALATARGPGDDEVTAWVLATAAEGRPLAPVVEYAADRVDADPGAFEAHAESLDRAGVVDYEDGVLEVADRLADADPEQLAAVAVSA